MYEDMTTEEMEDAMSETDKLDLFAENLKDDKHAAMNALQTMYNKQQETETDELKEVAEMLSETEDDGSPVHKMMEKMMEQKITERIMDMANDNGGSGMMQGMNFENMMMMQMVKSMMGPDLREIMLMKELMGSNDDQGSMSKYMMEQMSQSREMQQQMMQEMVGNKLSNLQEKMMEHQQNNGSSDELKQELQMMRQQMMQKDSGGGFEEFLEDYKRKKELMEQVAKMEGVSQEQVTDDSGNIDWSAMIDKVLGKGAQIAKSYEQAAKAQSKDKPKKKSVKKQGSGSANTDRDDAVEAKLPSQEVAQTAEETLRGEPDQPDTDTANSDTVDTEAQSQEKPSVEITEANTPQDDTSESDADDQDVQELVEELPEDDDDAARCAACGKTFSRKIAAHGHVSVHS